MTIYNPTDAERPDRSVLIADLSGGIDQFVEQTILTAVPILYDSPSIIRDPDIRDNLVTINQVTFWAISTVSTIISVFASNDGGTTWTIMGAITVDADEEHYKPYTAADNRITGHDMRVRLSWQAASGPVLISSWRAKIIVRGKVDYINL